MLLIQNALPVVSAVSYSIVFVAVAFDHIGTISSASRLAAEATLLKRWPLSAAPERRISTNLTTKCTGKLPWAQRQRCRRNPKRNHTILRK